MSVDWGRESVYLRRSLCLKRLVTEEETKEYTVMGVVVNIVYFVFITLLNTTLSKTFSMNKREIQEKVDGSENGIDAIQSMRKLVIYFAISKLFAPLVVVVIAAVKMYEVVFGFETLESWYVVLYSVTATIPILVVEKTVENLVADFPHKDKVIYTLYAMKVAVSVIFVENNVETKQNTETKKLISAWVCIGMQTLIVLLSINMTDYMYLLGTMKLSK